MIHKRHVLAFHSGIKWAEAMQALRDKTRFDPRSTEMVEFEGIRVKKGTVPCEKDSVQVWDITENFRFDAGCECEFVVYDPTSGMIVIAILVGDDSTHPLHSLFSKLNPGDRVFLVAPAKIDSVRLEACLLVPTGDHAFSTYGAAASPEYLKRLIALAKQR